MKNWNMKCNQVGVLIHSKRDEMRVGMNPEYAIFLLKKEKSNLDFSLKDMSEREDKGKKIDKRKQTGLKHQVGSLDFAIEVLETYLD